MTKIDLIDYISTDAWGWQTFNCIGDGDLSSGVVCPKIDNAVGDLTLTINSVGGGVFDGFAIYNSVKNYKGGKKICRITGLAASIASIIAMAFDEVIICQAALLMVHKPTIDPYWLGSMDATDLQREANALTQIEAVLNDIYVSKTGLGSTKIQNLIDAETWITPDMALMLGFADSIEKTITEQPSMAQNAFNHIFKNANPNIRAYANNAFKITTMSNPNEALINAVNKSTETTNSLMDWFKNKFGGKNPVQNASATLANGNAIYFNDGETLAEGTKVFEDEDQANPLADGDYEMQDATTLTVADGEITSVVEKEVQPDNSVEIEELRNQVTALTNSLNAANASLNAVNSAMQKLKDVKSTYIPPAPKQEFNNQNLKEEAIDSKGLIERNRARNTKKENK